MSQDKLLKFMAFIMNAYENTTVLLYGVIVLKYLTTWVYQLLLMEKYVNLFLFHKLFLY